MALERRPTGGVRNTVHDDQDLLNPEVEVEAEPVPDSVLRVRRLIVGFQFPGGLVDVVNGVDLRIDRSETLAVIGESGSGKSVTAASIMGILPSPPARIKAEAITVDGRNLLALSRSERRKMRGREMSLVLQDSLASLNPVKTVGSQIAEMFTTHLGTSRSDAKNQAIELLDRVGIASPRDRFDRYPHEYSGGMRQRAMIAIGIALGPTLLIADEPTTALDVTVQAQIIELLAELQATTSMAIMLITHNIAVASAVTHRIAVMYAGRIVESGPTQEVLRDPAHPYTAGLIDSIPRASASKLQSIPGEIPDPAHLPQGCVFHPRCPLAIDRCRAEPPPDIVVSPGRSSACHRYMDVLDLG